MSKSLDVVAVLLRALDVHIARIPAAGLDSGLGPQMPNLASRNQVRHLMVLKRSAGALERSFSDQVSSDSCGLV